jgi:amino acid transporter
MITPAAPPPERAEPLRRELSRVALLALALNGVVGAGIFALPATAAAQVGAWSPFVFLACGVLVAALMASLAQAASYFQSTGGPVLYTTTAFGPFVGFQTGWVLYVGRITSLAANGNLCATYLGLYLPGADQGVARIAVLAVLCGTFAALNIIGVKEGMRSVLAISVAKFLPLALFVGVGLAHLDLEPFRAARTPSYAELSSAALVVFYAFIGFEGALVPAGESRDPRRDLPRALFLTAGGVTSLYVLVQLVCVCTLPDLAHTERPLARSAELMIGAAGAAILTFGALMSVLGNFAAAVLAAPRLTYALARDGALPSFFGYVHPRTQTPVVSIALYATLGFALGAYGTFGELAVMSSIARLLGYLACLATLPRLARRFGAAPNALRLPGGLAIPLAAFAVCAWLVAQASWTALAHTGLLVLGGSVLFGLNRLSARRRGRAE